MQPKSLARQIAVHDCNPIHTKTDPVRDLRHWPKGVYKTTDRTELNWTELNSQLSRATGSSVVLLLYTP